MCIPTAVNIADNWTTLVQKDSHFASLLWNSSGIDDFEAIGAQSPYAERLHREKWSVIAHALAHLSFMNRLNSMLDSEQPAATPTALDDEWAKGGAVRRYAKRADNWGAPRKALPHEVHTARSVDILDGEHNGERDADRSIDEVPAHAAPQPPPLAHVYVGSTGTHKTGRNLPMAVE